MTTYTDILKRKLEISERMAEIEFEFYDGINQEDWYQHKLKKEYTELEKEFYENTES